MTQTVNVVIATAALEREKESDSENESDSDLGTGRGRGGGQWFETGREREWVSVDANGYSIGNKREAVSSPCRPTLTPGSTILSFAFLSSQSLLGSLLTIPNSIQF